MISSYRKRAVKKSFAKTSSILELPNLIQVQLDSFRWFQEEGLSELFLEFSTIEDFIGAQFELRFLNYEFRQPRHSEQECCECDMTYSAPLYISTQLIIKKTGEIKEQQIFMGDFPLMTSNGTFIISGTERVIVNQLIRSPGVYFTLEPDITSGRELCFARLVPAHGPWLEFEVSARDVISVKMEGKRKVLATTLLRTMGYRRDEDLLRLFQETDISPEHRFIQSTMEREHSLGGETALAQGASEEKEAIKDFYERLRPNTPLTKVNDGKLRGNLLFNSRHYNLGKVGRYKLNKRLGKELLLIGGILSKEELAKATPEEIDKLVNQHFSQQGLTKEDFVAILQHLTMINNGMDSPDDIDHLGNRRVRTVGEQIQNQLRIGLIRLELIIKERMSMVASEAATPSGLINIRPIIAALREFFAGSQLSQFMDQTNPLAELTHKRRLSALGPGGLSRERAGLEIRDVHYSHYGKICPIETPEGPNIGLIGALATYSQINEYGFIEAPYRRVIKEVPNNEEALLNRILVETVEGEDGIIAESETQVTSEVARKLSTLTPRTIKVKPFASNQIVYLSSADEEDYTIAQANTPLDENNRFVSDRIEVRRGSALLKETGDKVDFMDVSPKQIVSITTALIPFLEHDDANRALMGANMQRQAVPLLHPEPALITTGMEEIVAQNSGQVLLAPCDGESTSVTAEKIVLRSNGEEQVYPLRKFMRTNQGTCLNQRPLVNKGELVREGQILAASSATGEGELALGQNVLCAFMSWRGYNFEDAIIISESLVREDKFTSIHIERYEVEAQDTKLGEEEITKDIPGVGEESLRDIDEDGIIRIGAEVASGDILVGKITPKGEAELTAEEKLLRALFGEKARKVKDTSLRIPYGERGKVVGVRVFSHDNHDELPAGVNQLVRVWVAQKRKAAEGDKLTGRHGNKGVIARILPVEDMPFLPDGTPIEIILNPIGVPSRMNLGQILEAHLGWAAHLLGFRAISPVFEGASNVDIEDALVRAWIVQQAGAISLGGGGDSPSVQWDIVEAWLDQRGYEGKRIFSDDYPGEAKRACLRLWLEDLGVATEEGRDEEIIPLAERISKEKGIPLPVSGKTTLYDGCTGEPFDQPVTVGYVYMMKLIHLVEDKIHARSTGPYSLVTQQPLGGKAQFGGQRFGEMEAWALEAYGAAYTLQEFLTVKSDDMIGRAKAYEHIIKGEDLLPSRVPESFKVLIKELQSLGLAVEVTGERDKLLEEREEIEKLEAVVPRLKERGKYA